MKKQHRESNILQQIKNDQENSCLLLCMAIKAEIAKKKFKVRDFAMILLYTHKMEGSSEQWMYNHEIRDLNRSHCIVRTVKSKQVEKTLGMSSPATS